MLPILALGVVAWQVWSELLGWSDLIVFAIMYIATGLGITVGFHRLFTHRAFKTGKAVRAILAALGSAAIEGPVISWVADHRKHHAYSDKPGDPHSPHVDHGHGLKGALRGLLHAHVGLAVHPHRARAEDALRAGPDRRPGRQLHQPHVRAVGVRRARRAVPARLADRRHDRRGPDRPAVGRRRADAGAAPRDLQHQLALPLLRQADVQDRATSPATWRGCRSSPSARRGTTAITPSRPRPATVSGAGSSTPPRGSSGRWRRPAWRGTSCASPPSARPPSSRRDATASSAPHWRRRCRTGPFARRALGRHVAAVDERRRRPDLPDHLARGARPRAARAGPARASAAPT